MNGNINEHLISSERRKLEKVRSGDVGMSHLPPV